MRPASAVFVLVLVACGNGGRTSPANGPSTEADGGEPVAAAEPSVPESPVCTKNADCTLTTFSGCCTCCPGVPRAFYKPDLAKAEAKCLSVKCPACDAPCGPPIDTTSYEAQCVSARCVAVPR